MKAVQAIISTWQAPGLTLIVCDYEQTLLFWARLRQQQHCKIIYFPLNSTDFATWSGQLSQSFLGQSEVYWCVIPPAAAKNNKIRLQALTFLKSYTGPHAVWLLVGQEQVAEYGAVKKLLVAPTITIGELASFAGIFDLARSAAVVAALEIASARSVVSLDSAMALLTHAGYVPTRDKEQARLFLQKLLPQDASLTLLADLFFKSDREAFLTEWARLSTLYSDMFWVSFWTEQLWRAYWVAWYMVRGQQTRARAMSYRLPASFMQSGWRTVNLSLLFKHYEQVAFWDTGIKFGSYFSSNDVVTFLL